MQCPDDVVAAEGPARMTIIALAMAIVAIDLILLLTGHNTLSQYIQHQSGRHRWLRWVGLGGLMVLAWHIFWGFPW